MSDEVVHYEESDFFSDHKLGRQERKLAKKLDRSKYKKSDQDQLKNTLPQKETTGLTQGIVISTRSQESIVDASGVRITCTLRGALKKEKGLLKNLIVVGDIVYFDAQHAICSIQERKTVLSRADHLSQKKEHLIAANIDQVLITVSVVDPTLRPTVIDRYLIAAEKGNMRPIIICNKIDLLENPSYPESERIEQLQLLKECQKTYQRIGIPFLCVSSKTGQNHARIPNDIDLLRKIMKEQISVFSGQSGTGKSSLINTIAGFELKVGKTVDSSRKGAHTTSFAELLLLPFGGYIADTPGIKSFGIWGVKASELPAFFPEFIEIAHQCDFADCSHRPGEHGCAVTQAVEKGELSQLRYESYLNILSSIESEHFRR